MRETSFIRQNEEKWKEFEQILAGERHAPEKLNDLFIQVTDDLSFARTFYPNRSVRVYLNGLAQRVFFKIYKGKKSKRSRIAAFWLEELPLILYHARHELLFSFLLFAMAMAIGMISCSAEPEFLRSILGDSYVNMTNENISSGDPMAVYKQAGEFNMFLGITLNNLFVALITFLLGIFYGIGTIGSLLFNGIMLGTFQYFFIEKDLFRESFLAVWLHGAFEISSIVIAGAAGITMGKGLVFPGTLPRMRSFQLAARRGLSILVGVVPLFILAGFIESFLTRYTDAPDVLRAVFIFICLGFVLFYFVIFPQMQAKRGLKNILQEQKLTPDHFREVDYSINKTTGELFTDTFLFFRKNIRPIVWTALIGSTIYCIGAFGFSKNKIAELFYIDDSFFSSLSSIPQLIHNEGHAWLFPLMTFVLSVMAFTVHILISKEAAASDKKSIAVQDNLSGKVFAFLKTMAVVALFNLLILTDQWFTVFLIIFGFSFLFLWTQLMVAEGKGIFAGLMRSSVLASGNYGPMFGLNITLLICGMLFFFLLNTSLLQMLLEYLSMNFLLEGEQGRIFFSITQTFTTVAVFLVVFGLLVIGNGLQYFSNLEINEANSLRKRIGEIQTKNRIKGLEREG